MIVRAMASHSPASILQSFDFRFAPERDIRLQPYSGSAWRGAFGFALKRLLCVMRLRPCAGCPLSGVCLFPGFFGDDPEHETPRPYILAPQPTPPGGWIRAGEPFAVRLTLIGGAARAAPYVAQALVDAAARGLTRQRVPFACLSASAAEPITLGGPSGSIEVNQDPSEPPSAPRTVRLRLATPLRLRLRGDLVTGRSLTPAHILEATLRRARLLGLVEPERDLSQLRELARLLAWRDARFGWLETTRFSSRQDTKMQLGGIVGEAWLDLAPSPELWPWLRLASLLHVGKGASMGFGRIELHAE